MAANDYLQLHLGGLISYTFILCFNNGGPEHRDGILIYYYLNFFTILKGKLIVLKPYLYESKEDFCRASASVAIGDKRNCISLDSKTVIRDGSPSKLGLLASVGFEMLEKELEHNWNSNKKRKDPLRERKSYLVSSIFP